MAAKKKFVKPIQTSKGLRPYSRKTLLVPGLVIGLFAFLLYANTLGHDYAFDDYSVIRENFVVKKGVAGIPDLLTRHYRYGYWNTEGSLYRPLSLVMFALEWEIAPDQPRLGHFINVLLYAITGVLLYLTMIKLLGQHRIILAILTSLLFVAHPLHTEVVANIKSRDEILAFLFSLLALFSFLKGSDASDKRWFSAALLFFFLALFSKESAITWIAVLFLALYFFRKKSIVQSLRLSAPFLIPLTLFLLLRHSVIGKTGGLEGQVSILDNLLIGAGTDWATQFATALKIMGLYLYKLVIPHPLVSDMGYNQIPLVGWNNLSVWGSLSCWILLIGFSIKGFINRQPYGFPGLFLVATLSIYSNLIILIGSSYGERFLYVPSLAWAIGLGLMLEYAGKVKNKAMPANLSLLWKQGSKVFTFLMPVLLLYSVLTIQRNPDWKDSYSIYNADVDKSPDCAKIHYHLGLELVKKALEEKKPESREAGLSAAHREFERSLEIYPKYGDAYAQLGLNFYRKKDQQKAMEYYQRSLEYKPNNATVYNNMGILYFENGQLEKAQEVYAKAIELNPRYVDALRNLGVIYALKKDFDTAIEFFNKGLNFDPDNATLFYYLGSAYTDKGDPQRGKPFFEKAYILNPSLRK